MKINPNLIKITPKHMPFAFCVYGEPTEEISKWLEYWNIKTEQSGLYTNFILPQKINLSDIFQEPKIYSYVDGFSPNLNKSIHIGHLSNLIIAKSIQKLGVGENFIAVLGDTLNGAVSAEEALNQFNKYCDMFHYKVNDIYFASKQKIINDNILKDGQGKYDGTKIFEIDNQKIVAIKKSGSTTYFYQDVAVAQKLNKPTLYLTGFEQTEHFSTLKKMFPNIVHIGLGLIMLDGKKMSSSEGNVIMVEQLFDNLLSEFKDEKLVYNIIAGVILQSNLSSVKKIDSESIKNVKMSSGLYISYTQAKMWSAGIEYQKIDKFSSLELEFKFLKAKYNIQPNILLNGIIELCEKINQLYETNIIKNNIDNQKMFQILVNDLMLACDYLGFFKIDKV